MKTKDAPGSFKERMKKAFNECYKAVVSCEEEGTGRKRCELFREIPDGMVRTLFLTRSIAVLY
jgi:ATP-dependent helicase STH1/SNF2